MTTLHAPHNRIANYRRVAPGAKAKDRLEDVGAVRRRGEGRTTCTRSAPSRPATGLLIPTLSPSVPTAYGEPCGVARFVSELVEFGALKADASASSIEELMTKGIEALMPRGLDGFESQWGDHMVQVFVEGTNVCVNVGQDCHGWRMRLKPIVTALPPAEAADAVRMLNRSMIQGPHFWPEIVGFGTDAIESAAIDEDEQHTPAAEAVRHSARESLAQSNEWLRTLFRNHPALVESSERQLEFDLGRGRGAALIAALDVAELRRLLAAFNKIERTTPRSLFDNGALMVTSWDKDCYINHAHDYIHNGIHNDGWDNNDQECFATSASSVKELKSQLELIGRYIAAAQALEEWTNAHC